MISVCDWSAPGQDRYTGTIASAIAAYRLPPATQVALIDAFERRQFTDAVVIDRDSIRGQHAAYAPQLERMHFGSRGRICDKVTRDGWAPNHVETALVACVNQVCVAWPAVCGNVALVTRIHRAGVLPEAAYMDDIEPTRAGPLGTGLAHAYAIPMAPAISEGQGGYGASWGAGAGFGYAIDYRQTALCECTPVPACPVPAVPEPGTWAMVMAGLVAVAVAGRARR